MPLSLPCLSETPQPWPTCVRTPAPVALLGPLLGPAPLRRPRSEEVEAHPPRSAGTFRPFQSLQRPLCLQGLLARYGVLPSAAGTDGTEVEPHPAELHGKPPATGIAPQTNARILHDPSPFRCLGCFPFSEALPSSERATERHLCGAVGFASCASRAGPHLLERPIVSHNMTLVKGKGVRGQGTRLGKLSTRR